MRGIVLDFTGFAFAFISGAFSLLSPCGYALLPGYLAYFLGSRLDVRRAILGGLACTLGIISIFSIIGLSASSLGALFPQLIPFLTLIAGVVMILMGIITLMNLGVLHISLPVGFIGRGGLIGLYLFGFSYGLAAVGCSAPIFLSVLFYAMSRGLINGMIMFLAYSVGVGLPLTVTGILTARVKELIIEKIGHATPLIQRSSGIFLIIVGIYLLYFYHIIYG